MDPADKRLAPSRAGAVTNRCAAGTSERMSTLKVVVADDHRLMLAALRLVLEDAAGIELVGETSRGTQVVPLVSRTQPDVVLLDYAMPDMDGLAVLGRLRKEFPKVSVVMFSGSDDPELIAEALRMGASAFVLKAIDPGDLAGAIRQAVEGTVFRTIGRDEAAAGSSHGLTTKEQAVLVHMAHGRSNPEISKELWLSPQTVKYHLTNVYKKLGVSNRTEATRRAVELGIVSRYRTRT